MAYKAHEASSDTKSEELGWRTISGQKERGTSRKVGENLKDGEIAATTSGRSDNKGSSESQPSHRETKKAILSEVGE